MNEAGQAPGLKRQGREEKKRMCSEEEDQKVSDNSALFRRFLVYPSLVNNCLTGCYRFAKDFPAAATAALSVGTGLRQFLQ
jgi:hypothetical protein